MAVHGDLPQSINDNLQQTLESVKNGSPDAETKVDQTIEALKSGFI
jgi:hypothetical protein